MGKPISGVGGMASTVQQAPSQVPTQSPTQSPTQAAPAPRPAAPVTFWPPAYGWRLAALTEQRASHTPWQARWIEQRASIAGATPIDAVAQLRQALRGRLSHAARA